MAMRTQGWDTLRDTAAEVITEEIGMKERLAEQSHDAKAECVHPRHAPAMTGLIVAMALSLPLWIAIASLVWLLRR
jgi:hypothetical protein